MPIDGSPAAARLDEGQRMYFTCACRQEEVGHVQDSADALVGYRAGKCHAAVHMQPTRQLAALAEGRTAPRLGEGEARGPPP